MLICIKTLSGRKLNLDFESKQKIIEIKEALQEKEGIPKEQIRLIHSGKVMNDEMSLEESNISSGANIMMALHLKGGK